MEVIRFVEDNLDDDAVLLRSTEFCGAAVITRDKFRQSYYDNYPEGKSRTISFRFFRSRVPKDDYHKPEMMANMFTELKFQDFERKFSFKLIHCYSINILHFQVHLQSPVTRISAKCQTSPISTNSPTTLKRFLRMSDFFASIYSLKCVKVLLTVSRQFYLTSTQN